MYSLTVFSSCCLVNGVDRYFDAFGQVFFTSSIFFDWGAVTMIGSLPSALRAAFTSSSPSAVC